MTSKISTVRARITPDLKESAEDVLVRLGISSSQAINIFYSQIVLHQGLPFPITLETDDIPKNYTKVKNKAHLKSIWAHKF